MICGVNFPTSTSGLNNIQNLKVVGGFNGIAPTTGTSQSVNATYDI